jgi:hypothetical protein
MKLKCTVTPTSSKRNYRIHTNNKTIAIMCVETTPIYFLSLRNIMNTLFKNSPAEIGMNKRKHKAPKPGVQGPLGESFSNTVTVTAAKA